MIEYTLTLDDRRSFHFKVDPERAANSSNSAETHPFWTQLDYRQCSNCPLKASEHRHCPAALDIEQIVAAFGNVVSHHQVNVEVRTDDRTYQKRTDAQTAVRSLMGLCLATGGCPILARMKGPARLHLPFANVEETLFRMAGAYLLRQYFVSRQGGAPDWDLKGLNKLYEEIQEVNRWLKQRLDGAAEKDANVNAVVSLVNMAMIVSMSLEEQLNELEPFTIGDNGPPAPA
jgi:hypothetical protein